MTNECGQHNKNATLVKSMLQAFKNGNYKYAIWFSGDMKDGAKALQNIDLSLRQNGVAYNSYIKAGL